MKFVFLVLITLVVVIFVVVVVFVPYATIDTVYASGYSEQAFKSIKMGDLENSVISKLGTALITNKCEPFEEWIYSAEKQPHFRDNGEPSGTYTTIMFKNGLLTVVNGATSSSSFLTHHAIVGSGVGHLKMTDSLVESLKGADSATIKARFGPPTCVYDFKATKIYSYARAKSGGNYRIRSVGFDETGRVVYLRSSIYWD